MSVAAGRTFIAAVNKVKADFKTDRKQFYDRFIVGKEKPTSDDVAALTAIIEEAQAIAKFYHAEVDMAMSGFGGEQDNTISAGVSLLISLKRKAKSKK